MRLILLSFLFSCLLPYSCIVEAASSCWVPKSVIKRRVERQASQSHFRTKRRKSSSKNVILGDLEHISEAYSIKMPHTWQCIDDKTQLPEKLDMVFFGQGSGGLTPTLNLAQEVTRKSQQEYVEEVLAYHKQSDSTLTSAIFTHIPVRDGQFTIIKTEKTSSWGKVFCLQGVMIFDNTAYVLTSTATLEDYPAISKIFLKAITSFTLSNKMAFTGDEILEKALQAVKD